MAVGPLEQAFVDVVADLTSVTRDLDELHRDLDGVERAAAETGEGIENAFTEAGNAVERAFEEASRQIAESIRDPEQSAKDTGEAIERAFEEAARAAERAIEDIGPEAFNEIPGGARRAGEAIENAFQEARRVSKEALKDIGNASDFGTLALSANAIGEEIEQAFREASLGAREDLRDIGGADTFGPVVVSAEIAAETVEGSFRDAARDSTRRLATIGGAGAGFGLLSSGLVALAAGLGVAGGAMTFFGLKSAASLEQTTVGFSALLGSAEAADAFIRDLQQFAATTPFEFQGLADNARQILAMGEAAGVTQADVLPLLTTIGDLTSVLGQPPEAIDAVVRALSQMSSKGKISTEELLQIAEAVPGFPVFQAMADGLGISTEALQEQLREGTVPAREGIAALIDGMAQFPGAAGAMAAQAQTLTGLFSTFKDTISLALTEAFQPLVPTIKTALAQAVPVIETALGTIAPAVSGIAGTVVKTLVDIVATIGPELGTALGGLSEGLESISEGLSVGLAAAAPALTALAPLFDQLGEVIQPIIVLFGELIGAVIPPLAGLFTSLLLAVEPVIDVLAGAFIQVLVALTPALQAIATAVGSLLTTLSPIITEVAELLSGVLVEAAETLGPVLADVAEVLGGALSEALVLLAPVIKEVATAFAENFQAQIEALAPVLPELAEALAQIALAAAQLLVALLPLLIPMLEFQTLMVEKIGAPVLLAIAQAIAFLATQLANLVNVVITNAKPAFDAFVIVLSDLWHAVFEPFMVFIDAVVLPFLRALATMIVGPLAIAIATAVESFLFMWHAVLEPLFTFIAAVAMPILSLLIDTFQLAANVVGAVVVTAFDTFRAAVGIVGDQISFVMGTFISPLIDLLGNVLSPIIGTVVEAFGSMASGIGSVSDFIDGLLGFIDDAIDAIDDLIDKIDDLPGAGVAGKILGGIPGFQTGGIIREDVLAQLHAPEVVIPLDNRARALALAEQSGLLDLIAARPASAGASSSGGFTPAADGSGGPLLLIETLNVTLLNGTQSEANAAGGVIVDSVETALRRRQLAQTVRTLGS
jgi:tape measure domain-containing protein